MNETTPGWTQTAIFNILLFNPSVFNIDFTLLITLYFKFKLFMCFHFHITNLTFFFSPVSWPSPERQDHDKNKIPVVNLDFSPTGRKYRHLKILVQPVDILNFCRTFYQDPSPILSVSWSSLSLIHNGTVSYIFIYLRSTRLLSEIFVRCWIS